jgi:tagatose 6-phosphate kinase
MLLAAGLSPAWQQIVVLDSLRLGEVNRASEVHWCASGKVLNVGLALHRLSPGNAKTLALVGGSVAKAIEREFADENVPCRWVPSEAPTRVCTTVVDRGTRTITELVENARAIPPEEVWAFRKVYFEEAARADVVVLTGSLPAGAPDSLFADMLALTPGRAVLDIRGPALLQALEHRPFLVKPNREELGQTFGRSLEDDYDAGWAANQLLAKGAEWVLLSAGGGRAWLGSASGSWFAEPPRVEVVNPIGSGDCLAAGVAWGLWQGLDVPEAFRLGMAAAVLNVGTLLPARFDAEAVTAMAERIRVRRG